MIPFVFSNISTYTLSLWHEKDVSARYDLSCQGRDITMLTNSLYIMACRANGVGFFVHTDAYSYHKRASVLIMLKKLHTCCLQLIEEMRHTEPI